MMDGKAIQRKLVGSEKERAVSPVIGVILMVAITVILAAVIAAFVLDMGPGGDSVQAGVDVNGDGTSAVMLEVSDSGNADGIVAVNPDDGSIADQKDGLTTGETINVSDGSSADLNVTADNSYTIYAVSSDNVNDLDTLDDADGSIQVAEIRVSN